MGASNERQSHANDGLLLKDLRMPDFRSYAVKVPSPGSVIAESTRVMGKLLQDVMKQNLSSKNFRLFSPDENNSTRWQDALEVTNRAYMADIFPYDDHLASDFSRRCDRPRAETGNSGGLRQAGHPR
jgi:xylulose-5-phosphate/fructose-6-phosphate phosphoketolase